TANRRRSSTTTTPTSRSPTRTSRRCLSRCSSRSEDRTGTPSRRSLMRMVVCGLAVALALGATLSAAEPIASGPKGGEELPGPFHPLNVTGPDAGQKACLYFHSGAAPVAMVFAREATPAVAKLLKKLDEAAVKNKSAEMGGVAVFCNDDGGLKSKLEELAKKEGLKEVVLAIEGPAGPPEYKVAKDADVTVILYTKRVVKANHSFRKGELDDKTIEKVVADVSKIVK